MKPNVRPRQTSEPVLRVQLVSTAGPALDPRAMNGSANLDRREECSAARALHIGTMAIQAALPAWAKWCTDPALEPWTVGIEEEVMLLEPDGSPAWRSEDVLRALPSAFAEQARGETHGLALEL